MSKSEEEVTIEERDLLANYVDIVGIAVQNARLFSDLEKKLPNITEEKSEIKNSWLIIPFMLFQVFYFGVSRNGETEPLAVALICFGSTTIKLPP